MKKKYPQSLITLLLLVLLAGSSLPARATHILGAELTYTLDPADPRKIQAQLTLYTEFSQTNADNPDATVDFGAGERLRVDRTRRTTIPGIYYKSIYLFNYTYPANGTYTMSFCEQNRAVGIVNIQDSENQAHCIYTQVVIDPVGGYNLASAQFLTAPITSVPLGETVRHHIGVYEPEGDSLAYQLVASRQALDREVIGYELPGFIHLNSRTGDLTYTNPAVAGQYAFALKITEYRNKKVIGYLIREFSVLVFLQAPAFAQSLTLTPGAGTTITPQNRIYMTPNQVVSFRARLQDEQADSTLLSLYSDLAAHPNTLQAVKSGSRKNRILDITLQADPTLQRKVPYLMVLRAVSKRGPQDFSRTTLYTQEKVIWVYIGSDTVEGIRPPNPELGLLLYPNPAADEINIYVPRFRPGLQIKVYNFLGQQVWQQPLLQARTPLRRRQLLAGKYLYRVVPVSGYDDKADAYSGHFIFR